MVATPPQARTSSAGACPARSCRARTAKAAWAVCLAACLAACLLCLPALPSTEAGEKKAPKGGQKIERYPPSFRLRVAKNIQRGVEHLRTLQKKDGVWGNPEHIEVMGHTALPLLTLLKAGVSREDEQVQRSLKALGDLEPTRVYSTGIYLMALHASYQPKLDTLDTDVGSERAKRLRPQAIRKKMSKADLKAFQRSLAYLLAAQNPSGLWHYEVNASATNKGHDLSCSQYALLGLRAALDCGFKVPAGVWSDALKGLIRLQDVKGPRVDLLDFRVRGDYAFQSKVPAEARAFHYDGRRKHGPKGENTLWFREPTGSMTTAGVACLNICAEGLWRSRKFKGAQRKKVKDGVRDGVAWLQESFSVATNPGRKNGAHHFYYLYGLERMGMLIGRRWIGTHDWYKEGADLLLAKEGDAGGWGGHVQTSYAVLFLKRATRPADTVVTTD